MPILSIFYGIVVRMYFFDDKQHHEVFKIDPLK